MKCAEFNQGLDDFLDSDLPAEQQAAMNAHLESCAACRRVLDEARGIQAALRAMPVPAPSEGFADRVLRAAVERNAAHHHRHVHRRGFAVGFGSAAAAGLALWLVVGLLPMQPTQPAGEGAVSEISIAVNEPREVTLAFHSVRALEGAKISIQLPENVALVGYPGRRTLEWTADLDAGENVLRLPVIASGADGGQLVASLEHGNKVQTLKIRLKAVTGKNLSEQSLFGLGVA